MSRPTRQRARPSPTALAAIVFAALAAAALFPAAAGAASVRVEETGPPDSGERATLIFQAAPAEANALTVALKTQEADGAKYTLRAEKITGI